MDDEFLRGYLGLAEGEKDPRNLMLAFAIDRVLLIEFDVAKHIEVSFVEHHANRVMNLASAGLLQHYLLLLPDHLPTAT